MHIYQPLQPNVSRETFCCAILIPVCEPEGVVTLKINLSVAAYTFVIGIVISLFVAIIFNDVSMSITTSICYLAAVLAGIIFEMKN